ncbi:MAG: hypothetical protein QG673_2109 [Pseudomonadota bacterium]|jgi:hypothetical protein|nr:hypothetical protein [Pseudomonadota bacterium]
MLRCSALRQVTIMRAQNALLFNRRYNNKKNYFSSYLLFQVSTALLKTLTLQNLAMNLKINTSCLQMNTNRKQIIIKVYLEFTNLSPQVTSY